MNTTKKTNDNNLFKKSRHLIVHAKIEKQNKVLFNYIYTHNGYLN